MVMEVTELSLAATHDECHVVEKSRNSCMSESENNPSRKRKCFSDQLFKSTTSTAPAAAAIQTSVDLQLKDPLPLGWEQCLDLESGRMYYMNRKTLKKSWSWPENKQKIDLELNISTLSNCSNSNTYDHDHENSNKHQYSTSGGRSNNNNNNMVALACMNCHLLVILSKSSPSCPNCKYLHSFPTLQTQPPNLPPSKSPNTLSLLKY